MARSHRERVEAAMEIESTFLSLSRRSSSQRGNSTRRSLQLEGLERPSGTADMSVGVKNLPAWAVEMQLHAGGLNADDFHTDDSASCHSHPLLLSEYALTLLSATPHARRSFDCPKGEPTAGWRGTGGRGHVRRDSQTAALTSPFADFPNTQQQPMGQDLVGQQQWQQRQQQLLPRTGESHGFPHPPAVASGMEYALPMDRLVDSAHAAGPLTDLTAALAEHGSAVLPRTRTPSASGRTRPAASPAEATWQGDDAWGVDAVVPIFVSDVAGGSAHRLASGCPAAASAAATAAAPLQWIGNAASFAAHDSSQQLMQPEEDNAAAASPGATSRPWHSEPELHGLVDWGAVDRALEPPGLLHARAAMVAGAMATDVSP